MLPQYQRLDGPKSGWVFRRPFGSIAVKVVALPLLSFIFCVLWSVVYNFEQATSTHCHVYNFLPSISAAIGNYQPQRTVWSWAITIHFVPRLLVAWVYNKKYKSVIRKKWLFLVKIAFFLNAIENFALLGLSWFTSVDNYETHKQCFVTFIITSEVYMLISCVLNKLCRHSDKPSSLEAKSLKYKFILFAINLSSIALAGYFFMRHNSLCEPGVYSLFALFEYVVVLTNMGFHMTAYWDFSGQSLVIDFWNEIYTT